MEFVYIPIELNISINIYHHAKIFSFINLVINNLLVKNLVVKFNLVD